MKLSNPQDEEFLVALQLDNSFLILVEKLNIQQIDELIFALQPRLEQNLLNFEKCLVWFFLTIIFFPLVIFRYIHKVCFKIEINLQPSVLYFYVNRSLTCHFLVEEPKSSRPSKRQYFAKNHEIALKLRKESLVKVSTVVVQYT